MLVIAGGLLGLLLPVGGRREGAPTSIRVDLALFSCIPVHFSANQSIILTCCACACACAWCVSRREKIQVLEVISSTPQLQLEISDTEVQQDKKSEGGQPWASSAWVIRSYESRVVMYVHANSDLPGTIEGYVNVRTNVTEANAVVPVRVDVSDAVGLYFGPEEMVDFGAVSVTDPPLRYSVKVLSNTEQMLRVMGSTISSCTHVESGDACTGTPKSRELVLHRVVGVMLPKKFFPVGDLILTPQRGMRPGVHTGKASVFYQIDNKKSELTVPFRYVKCKPRRLVL